MGKLWTVQMTVLLIVHKVYDVFCKFSNSEWDIYIFCLFNVLSTSRRTDFNKQR